MNKDFFLVNIFPIKVLKSYQEIKNKILIHRIMS